MKWILPLPVFSMAGGRAAASAAAVSLRERLPSLASIYKNAGSGYASREWISGLLALPAGGLSTLQNSNKTNVINSGENAWNFFHSLGVEFDFMDPVGMEPK